MRITTSVVVRAVALGVVSGLLWFYSSVPGWGTFTRPLLQGGASLAPLAGLGLVFLIGYLTGASRDRGSLWVSLIAVILGVVLGRLAAAAYWGEIQPSDVVGALTLGFSDAGESRELAGTPDAVWIRATSAAVVAIAYVSGVLVGWRRAANAGISSAA
ncbi:MAG: hypothetical protein ACYC77_11870 [Coriobacteriia bacterium]